MRRVRARGRAVAASLAVGAVATAVLWVSDLAPGWLAPVLSAVVTAALVEETVRLQRRRTPRGDPVDFHVELSDVSYFHVPGTAGEPPHVVPASGHTVRLYVTAPERTVVLAGLRVVVVERRAPCGVLSPHAGILPVRAYTVLLDEDPPRLEPRGEDTPATFSYTVGPDDPETFELRVETERWQVAWELELDWVCGRRTGTVRVDLAGRPFRTAARPPRGLSWEDLA
ncbi:hypothetical protein [Streptomyces graminilatus]|uniref:hypothetical protein n=1 Tax=Streptomyces graminilatus TaxID=1464070 RepID=UPI0012FF52E4|nr:hypothetical protein [Streptomyces graminilatus]